MLGASLLRRTPEGDLSPLGVCVACFMFVSSFRWHQLGTSPCAYAVCLFFNGGFSPGTVVLRPRRNMNSSDRFSAKYLTFVWKTASLTVGTSSVCRGAPARRGPSLSSVIASCERKGVLFRGWGFGVILHLSRRLRRHWPSQRRVVGRGALVLDCFFVGPCVVQTPLWGWG